MENFDENEFGKILLNDEELNKYIFEIEKNNLDEAYNAISQDFSEKIIDKIKIQKQRKFKNTLIYYVSAASITIILTASGFFNLLLDGPKVYNSNPGYISSKTKSIFINGWTENILGSVSKTLINISTEIENIGRN